MIDLAYLYAFITDNGQEFTATEFEIFYHNLQHNPKDPDRRNALRTQPWIRGHDPHKSVWGLHMIKEFNKEYSKFLLQANLDLLEELQDKACLRNAHYQQRVTQYYNAQGAEIDAQVQKEYVF
ncbi:hypothetical protein ACLOJK_014358 [Asimina triloba]